ncbi:TlpA disulfide reductase family protein [Sphingomonas sp. AR_OL41]|uniref:TlpA family protein disulfide reductase n=1 Tax=Sphingomonas sp. AR_OL41 TaxID=3042729 RepID=UPI0024814B95|nr:TlpA disulfide reductase family protein [Sphingomonas sp. AR_OL41]MDH7972061.1 TlpA disulfide reductase family protein [Sphingomonas sp. AR_OL41]
MASFSSLRSVIVPLLLLGAVAGCDKQNAGAPQAMPSKLPVENSGTPADAPPAKGDKGAVDVIGTLDRSHKGEPAPAIGFTDAAGKPSSIAAFAGKPVLLNLWATWCAPCVAEMPTLDKAAASMTIVAVSQDIGADGSAKAAKFLRDHGVTHLQSFADPETKLSVAYNASLPTSILYDSTGHEVWRMTGGMNWTTETAKQLLAEAK